MIGSFTFQSRHLEPCCEQKTATAGKSLSSVETLHRSGVSEQAHPRTVEFSRLAVLFIFGLATLVYILQVFTPLRLTSDGITYLSFADAANQAHGLTTVHQTY